MCQRHRTALGVGTPHRKTFTGRGGRHTYLGLWKNIYLERGHNTTLGGRGGTEHILLVGGTINMGWDTAMHIEKTSLAGSVTLAYTS